MAALNNVKYVESEFNARPDTIQVSIGIGSPGQRVTTTDPVGDPVF